MTEAHIVLMIAVCSQAIRTVRQEQLALLAQQTALTVLLPLFVKTAPITLNGSMASLTDLISAFQKGILVLATSTAMPHVRKPFIRLFILN